MTLMLMLGCGPELVEPGSVLAEFSLEDVNSASATFEEVLSPADFAGTGSAWYFGHAT